MKPRLVTPPPASQDLIGPEGLRTLIATNELFAHMHKGQISQLVEMITEERWVEAETFLIHEGDVGEEFFVIRSGSFEVLKTDPATGRSYPLAKLEEGRSIGELALLHAGPRSASVKALKRSCVLVFRVRDIEAIG